MRSLPDSSQSRKQTAQLDTLTGAPPADLGERFFHDDLQHVPAAALWRELVIIHLRLALEKYPCQWWVDRAQHIVKELHRRGCPV